ncbi:MAG: heme ABC exporter ATP-binding protein CcmA [Chloroflexota bacterium]
MRTSAAPSPALPAEALSLEGVRKRYGATAALTGVDLRLGWGTVLGLFGHNGAGKSTLLRVLATLVRPDAGTALVAGLDPTRQASAVRAAIGYVGHAPLLYDDLTPTENLAFAASLFRLFDTPARIAGLLEEVGASAYAHRRVRTLSNGMAKRVALARALLHRPALLLLDEPETGLDADGLRLLDRLIAAVAAGGGAVVLSTHDLERGLRVADEALVLRRGAVALTAPTGTLDVTSLEAAVSGEGS